MKPFFLILHFTYIIKYSLCSCVCIYGLGVQELSVSVYFPVCTSVSVPVAVIIIIGLIQPFPPHGGEINVLYNITLAGCIDAV